MKTWIVFRTGRMGFGLSYIESGGLGCLGGKVEIHATSF